MQQSRRSFGSMKVKPPVAMAGQRIGIMGGSFNPPHDGHRIVAETAVKRLNLDQLWWVVTPGNPLKSNGALPAQGERMAWCEVFARGPRMRVTGFEAELGSPYTAVTVQYLRRRFPGVAFVWVMGADNLATFDRWQGWQDIAETIPLAVVDRPGWRLKALASPAAHRINRSRVPEIKSTQLAHMQPPAWVFLTTRLSQLSSTVLRDRQPRRKQPSKPL